MSASSASVPASWSVPVNTTSTGSRTGASNGSRLTVQTCVTSASTVPVTTRRVVAPSIANRPTRSRRPGMPKSAASAAHSAGLASTVTAPRP